MPLTSSISTRTERASTSAALYRFATTGEAGFIDRRLLQQTFQPK